MTEQTRWISGLTPFFGILSQRGHWFRKTSNDPLWKPSFHFFQGTVERIKRTLASILKSHLLPFHSVTESTWQWVILSSLYLTIDIILMKKELKMWKIAGIKLPFPFQVSIYLNNWSHVLSYVSKAQATPEASESRVSHLLVLCIIRGWISNIK